MEHYELVKTVNKENDMKDVPLLVPSGTPYVSGEVQLFADMVKAGESRAHVTLSNMLRIFLIHQLLEHISDPSIVYEVLATSLLDATNQSGAMFVLRLKRTGHASLLLAGLFPERALRLNVSSSYFRNIGRVCYGSVADHLRAMGVGQDGSVYAEASRHFRELERVLNACRGRATDSWGEWSRFRTQLN